MDGIPQRTNEANSFRKPFEIFVTFLYAGAISTTLAYNTRLDALHGRVFGLMMFFLLYLALDWYARIRANQQVEWEEVSQWPLILKVFLEISGLLCFSLGFVYLLRYACPTTPDVERALNRTSAASAFAGYAFATTFWNWVMVYVAVKAGVFSVVRASLFGSMLSAEDLTYYAHNIDVVKQRFSAVTQNWRRGVQKTEGKLVERQTRLATTIRSLKAGSGFMAGLRIARAGVVILVLKYLSRPAYNRILRPLLEGGLLLMSNAFRAISELGMQLGGMHVTFLNLVVGSILLVHLFAIGETTSLATYLGGQSWQRILLIAAPAAVAVSFFARALRAPRPASNFLLLSFLLASYFVLPTHYLVVGLIAQQALVTFVAQMLVTGPPKADEKGNDDRSESSAEQAREMEVA